MIDVLVHAIAISSDGTRLFELRGIEQPLPSFEAGAHIDVIPERGLCRPYSLCNDPAEGHRYLICVKRESHGGCSSRLHDAVNVGDRLQISPPRNRFALDPTAARHVLMGGGIGITPLVSMAYSLRTAGARFELHHYCSRPSGAPLFESLTAGPLAGYYRVHHSSAGESVREVPPQALLSPDPEAAVYICGPPGFDAHLTQIARGAGWGAGQLRRESFARDAAPCPEINGDEAFFVVLARRGCRLPVPANRTIAEVLLDHGIDVPLSCEQGICGACLTPVLAGEPDHRDEAQTEQEHATNGHITVCCSRARGNELTLDL